MTSDSIASFIDLARSHRLLPPEQVDSLFQESDTPRTDLSELCDFLRNRSVLTAYQTDMVRDGRGAELNVAGYTLTDDLGPCPGGTAYSALHPLTRTPVVLRRLRADAFEPADDPVGFLLRAQAITSLTDSHVAPLIDAGAYRGDVFVVVEPAEGSDLGVLVDDIGAMPANLAAEYGRQAAVALQVVHDRGLVHGHVRPGCLGVGPLVPMNKTRPDGSPRMRPAATARVRLGELGLEPLRPALADTVTHSDAPIDPTAGLAFLPPERARSAERTPAGDVYGLGACVYFLLTDRPPHTADTAGYLVHTIETADPVSLAALRPDCPPALVDAVGRMMAHDPADRPTAAEAVGLLAELTAKPKPVDPPTGTSPESAASVAGITGPGSHVEVDLSEPDPSPLTPPHPAGHDPLAPSLQPYSHPNPPPGGWVASPYPQSPDAAGVPAPMYAPAAAQPWDAGAHPPAADGFDPAYVHDDSAPIRPRAQDEGGGGWILWVVAGAVLNIIAVLGWIYLFSGDSTPEPDNTPRAPIRR